MKKDWEEEEEKLKKPRKRKSEKAKMKVTGKNVFQIAKELKKKK